MRKKCGLVCEVLRITGICTIGASLVFAIPAALVMIAEANQYALSLNMIPVLAMVMFGAMFVGFSKLLKKVTGAQFS